MKALIGALAVLILMIGAPSVMAFQAYWTPYSNSALSNDLKQYHLFLDGTYPSSVDRSTKLLNQDLSICLEFFSNHISSKVICHPIKESDIPLTNDSIVDAGYFVVPATLNETAAQACISGYHNWDLCNSQTIDANSAYGDTKILEHMAPTYDDVWVNDACLTYHHLKEGTPEFHECEDGLS